MLCLRLRQISVERICFYLYTHSSSKVSVRVTQSGPVGLNSGTACFFNKSVLKQ